MRANYEMALEGAGVLLGLMELFPDEYDLAPVYASVTVPLHAQPRDIVQQWLAEALLNHGRAVAVIVGYPPAEHNRVVKEFIMDTTTDLAWFYLAREVGLYENPVEQLALAYPTLFTL